MVDRGCGAAVARPPGCWPGGSLAARLVGEDGVPLYVGGWPAGAEVRRGVDAVEVRRLTQRTRSGAQRATA